MYVAIFFLPQPTAQDTLAWRRKINTKAYSPTKNKHAGLISHKTEQMDLT